jgi:hypothetical protein
LHGQKPDGVISRNKAYNADQVLGQALGQGLEQNVQRLGKKETHLDFNPSSVYNRDIMITDLLTKGFLRDAAVHVSLAAALGGASQQAKADPFGEKMIRAISSVESNNGQNTKHKVMENGLNRGSAAYGQYGLMPITARETARLNPEIHKKHPTLAALPNKDVAAYMDKNPGLEDEISQSHLKRLRKIFGDDPNKLAYAWIQGIQGAKDAIAQNKDIKSHWHVSKVRNALKQLENSPKQQSLADKGKTK